MGESFNKIGIATFFIAGAVLVLLVFTGGCVVQYPPVNDSSSNGSPLHTTISHGEALGEISPSNIVLNTAPVQEPDQILVYKTLPTIVSISDGISLAKKFNITEYNEPKEGDRVVTVSSKDMRYRVELFKNGGMSYEDYDRGGSPNGLDFVQNLPSDADAEKIATAFLKGRDLLPDGAVFGGSTHNKAYRINHSGGPETVVWEDILLGYTRELNGMKVEGTQFMVEVGAHGDIISFFTNWKYYEPIGNYSIKSRESALEELKQKRIAAGSITDKPDTISIETVHLTYLTQAAAYKEYYLEPVWVFQGRALVNGTSVGEVNEYIPALTDESVKSVTAKLG